MGWRDRDYNRGREAMFGFLGNPGSILGLTVPFGTWPGLAIRLHFWLLLFFLFRIIDLLQGPGETVVLHSPGPGFVHGDSAGA